MEFLANMNYNELHFLVRELKFILDEPNNLISEKFGNAK